MRVSVLVDGFNLYHSVKSAERQIGDGTRLRWLDLHGLCRTLIRSSYPQGAALASVYYFSALATHLDRTDPQNVERHRTLISAFQSTGIEVVLSRFKKKDNYFRLDQFKIQIPPLRKWFRISTTRIRFLHRSHEEKETDVAIACKLMELLFLNQCDAAIVLSGDADLVPAVRTARKLFPAIPIAVAFPFDRQTQDLERVASRVFRLSTHMYQTHQFPDAILRGKRKPILKPTSW